MSTGITVTVTQNGSQVSADIMGFSGLALTLGVGSSTLVGQLNGSRATLAASANHVQGNCTYTTTATADVSFDGNTMQGTISYSDAGNNSTACGITQACTSEQMFAGSRPPPSG
jgi:hypothetical protein